MITRVQTTVIACLHGSGVDVQIKSITNRVLIFDHDFYEVASSFRVLSQHIEAALLEAARVWNGEVGVRQRRRRRTGRSTAANGARFVCITVAYNELRLVVT